MTSSQEIVFFSWKQSAERFGSWMGRVQTIVVKKGNMKNKGGSKKKTLESPNAGVETNHQDFEVQSPSAKPPTTSERYVRLCRKIMDMEVSKKKCTT